MSGWPDISWTTTNGLPGNIEDMIIQIKTLHWRHTTNVGNLIGTKTQKNFVISTDKWTVNTARPWYRAIRLLLNGVRYKAKEGANKEVKSNHLDQKQ